jgi:predicted GNAT superfamily acetyltransferase
MLIRPLTTLDDCRKVAALERAVWGYADAEDVVPAPVLIVSIKRGGILLGAFDAAGEMKGFVYSMAGVKHGRLTQWSHMLGVAPEARGSGVGIRLKLAQRSQALAMGVNLIEWTYDPLQALNAHLNFAKLGAVAEEYAENLYGESSSPLHTGTPTDRFVTEWHLDEPHVKRRVAAFLGPPQATLRDQAAGDLPLVNPSAAGGRWIEPGAADLSRDEARLLVEIPTGFSEMQAQEPALARRWRFHTREIFMHYFARGYRAADFFLSRASGRGHYLLTTIRPVEAGW